MINRLIENELPPWTEGQKKGADIWCLDITVRPTCLSLCRDFLVNEDFFKHLAKLSCLCILTNPFLVFVSRDDGINQGRAGKYREITV